MGEAHRRWSNTPPGAGKRVGSQRRGCRLIAGQGPGEAAATPGRCGPGRSATAGSCFSNPFQKANDRVRKSWRQNSCPAPCRPWQSATGRLQALGPAPGLARCSPGRRVPSTHCGGGAKRGLPSLPRFSLPVSRGGGDSSLGVRRERVPGPRASLSLPGCRGGEGVQGSRPRPLLIVVEKDTCTIRLSPPRVCAAPGLAPGSVPRPAAGTVKSAKHGASAEGRDRSRQSQGSGSGWQELCPNGRPPSQVTTASPGTWSLPVFASLKHQK